MSRENIEILRQAYEAFNRQGPMAVLDILDPDIEWSDPPDFPGADTYRGREEVRRFLEGALEVFEEFRVDPEDFTDTGDQVVVRVRQWGRGKGSGVEIEARIWFVWTIRNGKAIRMHAYNDKDRALEAVGLRE